MIDFSCEFYKNDLSFNISGVDVYSRNIVKKNDARKLIKVLECLLNRDIIVLVNENNKTMDFIPSFIEFCKAENVNYKRPLSIHVSRDENRFYYKMIVKESSESTQYKIFEF